MNKATQEQLRARHAWNVFDKACNQRSKDFAGDFAAEVKRLPIRIRTGGLGQAIRFVLAKSKNDDHRSYLLIALGEWLLKEQKLDTRHRNGSIDGSALILAIINNDANFLRRATEESLLYLQWLTRFCEATIKENGSESE